MDNPVDADSDRSAFFTALFGSRPGYLCIAHAKKDGKEFREEYVKMPEDKETINTIVNSVIRTHNIWFCPMLLDKRTRKKENVTVTPAAWSDLDTCEPELLLVQPSIIIESSPGRFQGLWKFEKNIDPDTAENISQRIAYAHADDGADRSGWDLTQLLRMPYTHNLKYSTRPIVTVLDVNRSVYRLSDFDEYPQVQGKAYMDVSMPDPEDLPEDGEQLIQNNRLKMNPMTWQLYQDEPAKGKWSEQLWKLFMLLFEAGFDRNQVFVICKSAACNKFDRDGRSDEQLWKDVCRAEAKNNANDYSISAKSATNEPLLSDEERESLKEEETFVERYVTWAKSLGDAAEQYHQAGAFIILSSLLAGNVRLPTSFGTLVPNLWFMILADTTLTRKSTAMDVAMDVVEDIDPDVLLATDGSLEGLLGAVGMRPGKPGVFLRDEFSGLLEQMSKKDYMAGLPELLTKLYDGKTQKRILRKETIEVKNPILILFAGGIKDKITSLLTYEQVSSGFMPRFCFITAESDITKVKPLGPPTITTTANRDVILEELNGLAAFYNQIKTMNVENSKVTISEKKIFNAELTQEAWYRYNALETSMLESGMASERPDIMTPVHDRLCKSILKAAVLLATSEQRSNEVVVELKHLLRAMGYGENWLSYATEVMGNIGKGQDERMLDNIYRSVLREPEINRSRIMNKYHLTARSASQIFETLEQRNLIIRQKRGRGEVLTATDNNIKSVNFSTMKEKV